MDPTSAINLRHQRNRRLSDADLSHLLEESIATSKHQTDAQGRLKSDLVNFIKQEEQLISFNSSSPRFQNQASHLIRIMPGRDSISGVSFRVR